MLPMFTTVDPAGLRADLQLVSGVQSEGKLYEWLSMAMLGKVSPQLWVNRCLCKLASLPDACAGPSLEISAPPV